MSVLMNQKVAVLGTFSSFVCLVCKNKKFKFVLESLKTISKNKFHNKLYANNSSLANPIDVREEQKLCLFQ